jgi:hypothetical protein
MTRRKVSLFFLFFSFFFFFCFDTIFVFLIAAQAMIHKNSGYLHPSVRDRVNDIMSDLNLVMNQPLGFYLVFVFVCAFVLFLTSRCLCMTLSFTCRLRLVCPFVVLVLSLSCRLYFLVLVSLFYLFCHFAFVSLCLFILVLSCCLSLCISLSLYTCLVL